LPYTAQTVDRIAAIHVLEHLYVWQAETTMRHWVTCLKPGGELIVEVPCMDKVLHYIAACLKEHIPVNLAFSWWAFWGDPKHQNPSMCHRWGYTEHSLMALMTACGLTRVACLTPSYHFAERDMRVVGYKGVGP
jgi:hypothetical protein